MPAVLEKLWGKPKGGPPFPDNPRLSILVVPRLSSLEEGGSCLGISRLPWLKWIELDLHIRRNVRREGARLCKSMSLGIE
jgi:hypothetical protein